MKLTIKAIGLLLISSLTFTGVHAERSTKHISEHQALLAQNKKKQIDTSSIVDMDTPIAASASFKSPAEKQLDTEIEISMEGWNSRSVNPFKESQVPERKVINLSGFHMPVPGRVTSNYGYRAKFGRMHKGVDLALRVNDTVRAAFDGKIRLTNYEAKGYGNYVIIRHPNGLETVYGHLNKHLVKDGQVVKAGDPIGLGGSTGRSTGPHLHFETRFMGYAINPAGIFDFQNQTIHNEEYLFTKKTYTEPRNIKPNNTRLADNEGELNNELSGKETSYVNTTSR